MNPRINLDGCGEGKRFCPSRDSNPETILKVIKY
jgi:hypothetical protein